MNINGNYELTAEQCIARQKQFGQWRGDWAAMDIPKPWAKARPAGREAALAQIGKSISTSDKKAAQQLEEQHAKVIEEYHRLCDSRNYDAQIEQLQKDLDADLEKVSEQVAAIELKKGQIPHFCKVMEEREVRAMLSLRPYALQVLQKLHAHVKEEIARLEAGNQVTQISYWGISAASELELVYYPLRKLDDNLTDEIGYLDQKKRAQLWRIRYVLAVTGVITPLTGAQSQE